MNEANDQKRVSRLPFGLLGMLVLIVFTERYIGRRNDLSTMVAIEWRMTGSSVRWAASKATIACFGTSLTKTGVSPKVLEERLGKPAFNFAASGSLPFATYRMFRQVLECGGKPEAVVVDFKWSSLMREYSFNERVLPEVAGLRECAELAWTARDPLFLGRVTLITILQSYRCREEIRSNVLAAIQGKEPVRNQLRRIVKSNALANNGANHAPRDPKFKGAIDLNDASIYPKDWKCHPIAEIYVNKFLELAVSRNIKVFWLIPPVFCGTQAERERIGADEKYTEFVKATVAKYPGVTVVDGRHSEFPIESFYDWTHLNRDGAVAQSALLADAIKQESEPRRVDGEHWVSLAKYTPSPNASRILDTSDSFALFRTERAANARR
jgi:hypothetical protein